MLHFADAEEGERHMGERRQVAGGANGAFRRDARIEALVIELEQPLDEERPHAGIASGEALDLERERQAHSLVCEHGAGARRVRQHDVPLQRFELAVGDAGLRQAPEPSVDAVCGLTGGKDALHGGMAVLDARHAIRIQAKHRRFASDRAELAER